MGILYDLVTGGANVKNCMDKFTRVAVGAKDASDSMVSNVECVSWPHSEVEEFLAWKFGSRLAPVRCSLAEGKKAFNFHGVGLS